MNDPSTDIPLSDTGSKGSINKEVANQLTLSQTVGGIGFENAVQAMEFAKMMAAGGVAVPKHLRSQSGTCLAIVVQAVEWRMSPYAVANKSYSVNDRLAYESQLVQAVILQRAPIRGRLKAEFTGKGLDRVCRISAVLAEDGETVDYSSPPLGKIQPRNSPLWVNDPDQQLYYYAARAFCRRHFPDILLGVYAKDELLDQPMVDVTPRTLPADLAGRLDMIAAGRSGDPSIPDSQENVEDIPAPASANAIASATATALALLRRLAEALALARTTRDIERTCTTFLDKFSVDPDGPMYRVAVDIRLAHIARVEGKSSPAETDAMIGKLLTRP